MFNPISSALSYSSESLTSLYKNLPSKKAFAKDALILTSAIAFYAIYKIHSQDSLPNPASILTPSVSINPTPETFPPETPIANCFDSSSFVNNTISCAENLSDIIYSLAFSRFSDEAEQPPATNSLIPTPKNETAFTTNTKLAGGFTAILITFATYIKSKQTH